LISHFKKNFIFKLKGPSTRRPSTIVARLMERMRDNLKDDLRMRRTSSPLIDNHFSFNKNEKNDLLSLPEESAAEEQSLTLPLESRSSSGKSNLADSRKSSLKSLKRQERIELEDEKIFALTDTDQCKEEDAALLLTNLSVSQDSSGFHELPQNNTSQGYLY